MADREETTREKVLRLNRENPTWNMSDIARDIRVSRERVRQIAESEGLLIERGVRGVRSREARSPEPRVSTGGILVPINHTAAGLIGELLVAADLTARGYVAFIPLTRNAECDLIAMSKDGRLEKIEVRCGKRTPAGITYNRKPEGTHDRYAIVITGEPVIYKPDLPNEGKR